MLCARLLPDAAVMSTNRRRMRFDPALCPTRRRLLILQHASYADSLERCHEGRTLIEHGQNRVSGFSRKHEDDPINARITVAF
jgi:hypothetical protein